MRREEENVIATYEEFACQLAEYRIRARQTSNTESLVIRAKDARSGPRLSSRRDVVDPLSGRARGGPSTSARPSNYYATRGALMRPGNILHSRQKKGHQRYVLGFPTEIAIK